MTNNPTATLALACTLLCTTALAQQKGTFTDTRDGFGNNEGDFSIYRLKEVVGL